MTARVAEPYKNGHGPKPRTAQEHIDHNSSPVGGCLIWSGAVNKDGYGKAWFQGRSVSAHRLAFLAANGRWPDDLALHTCDTPACVNADHLYDGTPADNQRDRAERTGWDGVGRKPQTRCHRGHEYDGTKNKAGHNVCLVCLKARRSR